MDAECSLSFVVLDSSSSACSQFSFDVLESFSADDSQGADAIRAKVRLDETLTGFDTSTSFDLLDSSIDSVRSQRFDCRRNEELCYWPLSSSTPLKPTASVEERVKRVRYAVSSATSEFKACCQRLLLLRAIANSS